MLKWFIKCLSVSATQITMGNTITMSKFESIKPLVIHNHLHMNEKEIGSIVTKYEGGMKRERHFR